MGKEKGVILLVRKSTKARIKKHAALKELTILDYVESLVPPLPKQESEGVADGQS